MCIRDRAYTVLQKLVQNKVLDPETWTQDDDTALNKFYRGETVIMSTNRAQYACLLYTSISYLPHFISMVIVADMAAK